jgi:hypothetical protein
MTQQAKERLIYQGEMYEMNTFPLEQYFSGFGQKSRLFAQSHCLAGRWIKRLFGLLEKPPIFPPSSSCWRGYYGAWEIKSNKLYLVDLIFFIEGGRQVGIEYIFPGKREVFARWFNGEIRLLLNKSDINTLSLYVFNDELVLEFKHGILINSRFVFEGREKG